MEHAPRDYVATEARIPGERLTGHKSICSDWDLMAAFYRGMGFVVGVVASAIAVMIWMAIVAALWATEARAHTTASGVPYPTRCCWSPEAAPAGRAGDCDEIPTERVKVSAAGYVVTLYPGDHPMVKEPITFVVPYEKVENSLDGAYHVCFKADMSVRCFFAGARGA
jgi:hypothetical protein